MVDQLLTVEQAAKRLHVHPITVRRQLRSGVLRGFKRGNLWRVPESAITETAFVTEKSSVSSAFDRAMALVAQLEEQMRGNPRVIAGVSDVAEDLREIEEAETS